MMRRHTHGWVTQQSNQGAVSGASDQGGYTRNPRAGGIQQEGQNKEENRRIRRTRRTGGQEGKRTGGTGGIQQEAQNKEEERERGYKEH